jgi:riboflavin biosynthesis pyrimidine reductase
VIEPLELLYETDGLPTVELPRELARLHAGDLGFHEPCVYANFVTTLDGVVAIPGMRNSNAFVARESDADRFLMGLLRAFADVVLIGSGVLRASPRGTWRPEKIYPPAAAAYAELRSSLALPEAPEATIPGDAIRGALLERGHRRVLCEAGPHTFGRLLSAGVVDELFLTTSPLLVGEEGPGSRLRLVEGADLVGVEVEPRLLSLRRHGSHLFHRYELAEAD